MKRIVAVAAVLVVAVAAGVASAADGTVYGKGVSIEKPVTIAELMAAPENFVGKQVRVDGTVTAVCAMRGCWMMLTDNDQGQGIRIKVEDGVIVFPMDAMGRKASAEGVFEVVNPTGEHMGEHSAEAKGEHAESGQAMTGEAPHACSEQEKAATKAAATYQIAGIGAIVY